MLSAGVHNGIGNRMHGTFGQIHSIAQRLVFAWRFGQGR